MIFNNRGILGINARNLLYIRPYNRKKAIKLADDKVKTKQFLAARDISVPKLYQIIKTNEELERFDFNALPSNFVIKPNHGFGGEGIIPIVGKKDNYWISAGGKKHSKNDLKDHINDILDGRFSISNVGDTAFFEQYIISGDELGRYSHEGLPDIRVVVHNLIPVMAMLRLPTEESKGKANLHMGAVGVGIDIAKGQATHIVYKNKIIDEIPGGLGKIRGVKIPYWDEILLIASRVQLITNLGYLAADICLDKNVGPVLLEINARAGLGVQIANLAPLRKRLERIEGVKVTTPIKGVRIAKDMFGNTLEKEIEHLSGKQIIGTHEDIEIIQKQGTLKIKAKIDTGKTRSIIDEKLAIKAGLLDSKDYDDEKSTLRIKFSLKGKRIQTIADVERITNKDYKFIIASRDLSDFLVDSSISTEKQSQTTTKTKIEKHERPTEINFSSIDQDLIQIDNKIKLLYHLRPLNLASEEEKFFKDTSYNPQFEYPALKFDPIHLIDKLEKVKTDESPLGKFFEAKKIEISKKISLLDSIDTPEFTDISISLFEKPRKEDIELCREQLRKIDMENAEKIEGVFDAEEAKKRFEEIFEKYGLKNWKAKIKEQMVANCVAGKNNRLFVKKDAKFSKDRIETLVVHEIETHIITAENGKMQNYELFNRGSANYLTTQEGMAMYNVEKQRKLPFLENHKALGHVIAIDKAINASFSDVFHELLKHKISPKQAYRSALKAKRGFEDTSKPGAFTKDYIYFRGYFKVKNFIDGGGEMKDLYIGKIDLDDLEIIKNIPGIIEAKMLPNWLK